MMMKGAWGLEIDKGRIALCRARLTSRGLEVTQGMSLPLPSELITPSLTELNVAEGQALSGELRSLMKSAGCKGGPVVLALPDTSCRIGSQDFEALSGTPSETRQLLCWRLKDRIPFPIQEARVDYQPLPGQKSGTRLLYLLARETVIAQYEALVASVGLEPIRTITRGLALYRMQKTAGIGGKRLLLAPGRSSLVFIYAEEQIPRMWRVLPWNGHDAVADQKHGAERMLREIRATIRYLRDEIGAGEPDRLVLMGEGEDALAESLRRACGLPVHTIPDGRNGVRGELLGPAGAALLRQSWRPRWISR
jgi:hypothetical protein